LNKWYIIEATVNFIQVLVIFKVFELNYERRFKFRYSVEIAVVVMTAILCLLNYNISIDFNPFIYLSYILLIYIFTLLIFRGNAFSKAATTFLLIVILGICELLAAVFIFLITGLNLELHQEQNFIRFEGMLISQTLFVYTYMFMKKRDTQEKLNLLNTRYYLLVGTILFLTVTVIVMVIWMYGNIKIENESINNNLAVLTLCVSLISIVSLALTDRIVKDMAEKHKNDLELQHMKMEHTYFSDVNSVLEEIRILRHDMRGELAIIHGYNELNQREKIRNHIEKKLQEMDIELLPQIDSDNIITSFLNFKLKEAQSKSIELNVESSLTEEIEIFIDKEDICRILNNLINNAIEACNYCDEKYIELDIDVLDNCLIIRCENPYSGNLNTEGDKILTIKEDKTRHGYGLKSIKGIAEKYGGLVKLNHEDNLFTVEIQMLNKI